MNIKVKPEGRDGVWLSEKKSLIDYLVNLEHNYLHNITPGGLAFLGADWTKESVIEKVKEAERIAILTGEAYRHNLNHALAVIHNNKLYMFDIGEVKETNLTKQ